MKVLVLIENSRATIAELRSLHKMNDVEVHLAANTKVFTDRIRYSIYIKKDNFHTYGDHPSPMDFLQNLAEKIGPYTILPNGESVLRIIAESKNKLAEKGITIPLPDAKTYKLFSDKLSFTELCKKHEIQTPVIANINRQKFEKQFVIKPKALIEKTGVLQTPMLVENEESFRNFKSLGLDLNSHFIQKLIIGPSYYYCASYQQGKKKAWFIQKNLHQQPNGKSIIKAMPYTLPESIVNKIDVLMEYHKWDGVMMFELKECNETQELYAIECNPRFWGPLQLALDNGVDFVKSLLDPDYKNLIPSYKNVGYVWQAGYFHGWLLKLKTKTSFQKFQENDSKINYTDLWARKDSMIYFLMEPLIIFMKEIKERLS